MTFVSQMPEIKTRILNFTRSNPGYGPVEVSKMLSIPLMIVNQAVSELKKDGLLAPTASLKIGRRIG